MLPCNLLLPHLQGSIYTRYLVTCYRLNLQDSIYTNWKRNMEFYHDLVATGVYINAPDPYFLDGTHKDGMGYGIRNLLPCNLLLTQRHPLRRHGVRVLTVVWHSIPVRPAALKSDLPPSRRN